MRVILNETLAMNLQIRREKNVAVVSCGKQHADITRWSALINELDELDCPAVIDARTAYGDLSEIDAYLLALHADDKPHLRSHRIAFVVSNDTPASLRFLVVSARNRGMLIDSFDTIDAATAWASTI